MHLLTFGVALGLGVGTLSAPFGLVTPVTSQCSSGTRIFSRGTSMSIMKRRPVAVLLNNVELTLIAGGLAVSARLSETGHTIL